MMMKRILRCLLITAAALMASLPSQAAMIGTAQIQAGPAMVESGDVLQQRNWIRQQLVQGGVDETDAVKRVAAMTDVQVAEIHQRIDEMPAGGTGVELLIIIGLVLVITEMAGYTDIFPNWPAK